MSSAYCCSDCYGYKEAAGLFLQQRYGKEISVGCVAILIRSRSHIQHHHRGVLLNLDVMKKMLL